MLNDLIRDIQQAQGRLHKAALDAGALIEDYANAEPWAGDVHVKHDGTPVTVVDRMAEDIVVSALEDVMPDIPVIAEERFAAGDVPSLQGQKAFWLVDALDGTKEFVAGTGEYTVNIALIFEGQPIYGLIYAPAKTKLYEGLHGVGSYESKIEDHTRPQSRGVLRVRDLTLDLTLVTSIRQTKSSRLTKLFGGYHISHRKQCGSSLKFAMIAGGRADLYPRLGYTSEWDTAAGDAILRQAGGIIINTITGEPLTYGHEKNDFLNPHFVALPQKLYAAQPDYFKQGKP